MEPAVRLALMLRALSGGSDLGLIMNFHVSAAAVYDIFHNVIDVVYSCIAMSGVPYHDYQALQPLSDGCFTSRINTEAAFTTTCSVLLRPSSSWRAPHVDEPTEVVKGTMVLQDRVSIYLRTLFHEVCTEKCEQSSMFVVQ